MSQRRTPHWSARLRWLLFVLPLVLAASLAVPVSTAAPQSQATTGTYTNPLPIQIPGDGLVESCADPSIIRGQTPGDNYWYVYCTKDPLNDEDRNASGDLNFHVLPMSRSLDLVNWEYVGDAFSPDPADPTRPLPSWFEPDAGVFAPEMVYLNNRYYLYYSVTNVKPEVSGAPDCRDDFAIGVATSASPTGPFTDLGRPVVEPRYNGAPRAFGERECNFFVTIDAEVNTDPTGQKYIHYGSYYGGIQARQLSADGFTTDPATAVQVAIPNRYEGAEIVSFGGFYYLFVSATNCCNGPLTGYSVFAGRSTSLLGPFVDRDGVSFLQGRVGGTPVLSMNGNRWVGPGHNSVFQDFEGQYWTVYHAIDRNDPYFDDPNPFRINKRPLLMDAVDFVNGWPMVRGGRWASDTPQPAPAAQPGDESAHRTIVQRSDRLGPLVPAFSNEFDGDTLGPQFKWVRQPEDEGTYGLENGTFRFNTQAADLFVDSNNASVLYEPTPEGNYVVETRVKLNLPPEECCFNFVQAGLVIYGDDDNYLKLVHVSIFETRQTEFAKELAPVPPNYPRYGNTVVGPPEEWTYLRIVKRTVGGEEHYTAYTRQDREGASWVRGGTWTHNLGVNTRIGLVSMGGEGFVANFDYVRVYRLLGNQEVFLPLVFGGPIRQIPIRERSSTPDADGQRP